MMKQKAPITKNDLVFHASHGLCRVVSISPSSGSAEAVYSLLPTTRSHAKVRFTIPQSSLENSGFNKLMTAKDANAILDYFKSKKKKDSAQSQAWDLASFVLSEAAAKGHLKDKRNLLKISQSVKSLISELALVLPLTATEIAKKIRENLGKPASINPLVSAALVSINEE